MIKKRVLVLCTGNSCRSHMAEGLINHFRSDKWVAHSAGTEPAGYVHPLAIQAMAEIGIDISEQFSKSTDLFRYAPIDLVITVCDNAAEHCPIWLGDNTIKHIGFPDPAKAEGTKEEQLTVFRQVRDSIQEQVLAYLQDW